MPAIRGLKSKSKTRRRQRDVDQVYADLRDPKHLAQHKDSKAVEDLPALGQFYCVECAKWFEQEKNLNEHQRSKTHKRRLRQLKEEPYTQKEAEAAAGYTTTKHKTSKSIKVETTETRGDKNNNDITMDEDDDTEEMNAFLSAY